LRVFTWTAVLEGRSVCCVLAVTSRSEATALAGMDAVWASLELGETLNPEFVELALKHVGEVVSVGVAPRLQAA
jgi:hypothetical protein